MQIVKLLYHKGCFHVLVYVMQLISVSFVSFLKATLQWNKGNDLI